MEGRKLRREDYHFIKILGRGGYSRVAKAQHIETGEVHAIKIVEKALLHREKKEATAIAEASILHKLNDNPGVVRLYTSFEDEVNFYYALEFCPYGDFYTLIRTFDNSMPYNLVQHYAGELVRTLEKMHMRGIAHRDLKPENLLLADHYHLKLTDFGTARDYSADIDLGVHRRSTFVGTAQYVSPEVLKDEEAGSPVDLWALGCVVYQMFTGKPPFNAATDYLIFEKIKRGEIEESDSIPETAKDLIGKLLVELPSSRLGAGPPGSDNDFHALKAHPFFHGVQFEDLYQRHVPFGELPEIAGNYSDDEEDIQELNLKNFGVLLTGVLMKKRKIGLFYNKRILTITSQPKIYYMSTDNVYKGEIPICRELKAEVKSKKQFIVKSPKKDYCFKEMIDNPNKWVQCINKLVEERYS